MLSVPRYPGSHEARLRDVLLCVLEDLLQVAAHLRDLTVVLMHQCTKNNNRVSTH